MSVSCSLLVFRYKEGLEGVVSKGRSRGSR